MHATAIAAEGRAAIIMGESGAGKSDLALRALTSPFVDAGRLITAWLVADDQVVVERVGDRLVASPPPAIAGKLEVRGIGIVEFPHVSGVELQLAVRLRPVQEIERLPVGERYGLLGLGLPLVEIDGGEPGAVARLMLALLGRSL